jgi:hypothetical protein
MNMLQSVNGNFCNDTLNLFHPVEEHDIFKSASQIPSGGRVVKILAIEYMHYTSSSVMCKSQCNTNVQGRLCN